VGVLDLGHEADLDEHELGHAPLLVRGLWLTVYSGPVVAHALSSMGLAVTVRFLCCSSLIRCSNVSMPICSVVVTPVPTISGTRHARSPLLRPGHQGAAPWPAAAAAQPGPEPSTGPAARRSHRTARPAPGRRDRPPRTAPGPGRAVRPAAGPGPAPPASGPRRPRSRRVPPRPAATNVTSPAGQRRCAARVPEAVRDPARLDDVAARGRLDELAAGLKGPLPVSVRGSSSADA